MEKIGVCCDHAGYELKEVVKPFLEAKGFEVLDFGTHTMDSCDYADFAHPMGAAIDSKELSRGIAICGSANGITMTINKHQSVRAAICWELEIAALARQHNDANVCSIPARFVSESVALEIVSSFLETEFEGGRHQYRVDKIAL